MKTKMLMILSVLVFALAFFAPGLNAAPDAATMEAWENSCASCHGPDGKADTKVGKKLKIRDYTQASFQGAVTDEELIKATADGVPGENGKMRMKGFSGEYSEAQIKALVGLIRSFGKG